VGVIVIIVIIIIIIIIIKNVNAPVTIRNRKSVLQSSIHMGI